MVHRRGRRPVRRRDHCPPRDRPSARTCPLERRRRRHVSDRLCELDQPRAAPDDIEGIRRLYPIRGPVFVRHTGRCLDIEGISTDNGADATQWEYWGGQNQIFRIEWVEAAHYRLIAQHSGRVIDVEAFSTANGAQVQQWDWWGGDNQKFRLDPVGHGYYRVVPKHSGMRRRRRLSVDNGAE